MLCRAFRRVTDCSGTYRKYSTADNLRSALRHFPQPVVLLTGRSHDDKPRGIIVSSFTSLSLDPPRVTFNVKTPSRALSAMQHGFIAHILTYSPEHIQLAKQFSTNNIDDESTLFRGPLWTQNATDAPALKDDASVTKIFCATNQMVQVGDHCIVIGNVLNVIAATSQQPGMVYRNRKFIPVEPNTE